MNCSKVEKDPLRKRNRPAQSHPAHPRERPVRLRKSYHTTHHLMTKINDRLKSVDTSMTVHPMSIISLNDHDSSVVDQISEESV